MEVEAVVAVEVVEVPELRLAAKIFFRPGAEAVAPCIESGTVAWPINRRAGRKADQHDYRREDCKPTHAVDMVSLRNGDKTTERDRASYKGMLASACSLPAIKLRAAK
jgi:hypothetical protein